VGPPYSRTKIYAARVSRVRRQLSSDICCPRPTPTVNPPAAAAAVDRRDRQTDGRTTLDTRPDPVHGMMETYDYDHQYILTLYHYIIPLYAPCPYSDFRWGEVGAENAGQLQCLNKSIASLL